MGPSSSRVTSRSDPASSHDCRISATTRVMLSAIGLTYMGSIVSPELDSTGGKTSDRWWPICDAARTMALVSSEVIFILRLECGREQFAYVEQRGKISDAGIVGTEP